MFSTSPNEALALYFDLAMITLTTFPVPLVLSLQSYKSSCDELLGNWQIDAY